MTAEFQARLDAIVGQARADKRAGGPWRLYTPLPGTRRLHLMWSYASREAAEAALAPMYPAVRQRAKIRYEA